MTAVADAGPLIALARIGYLALLPRLFEMVIVPPAVHREITTDADLPGAQELLQADWMRVGSVHDLTAVQRLRFWLDLGESEAIVLAREVGATLLIDERRGRRVAVAYGLAVTGTAGVVLTAKRLGYIQRVTTLLDALRAAGVRLSDRLYDEMRARAGEIE